MALRATTFWNEVRKDTMAGDVTIDIWGGSYTDVRASWARGSFAFA